VPYTVDKKLLSSSYGILTAIQNLGMAAGPFMVTFAHDLTKGYKHGFFAVNILNAI